MRIGCLGAAAIAPTALMMMGIEKPKVAILAAVITWRTALVRTFPQTASLFATLHLPVNLRGLAFEDVKSSEEFDQGVMVLLVDGRIVNVTNRVVEVPRLRLGVRRGGGWLRRLMLCVRHEHAPELSITYRADCRRGLRAPEYLWRCRLAVDVQPYARVSGAGTGGAADCSSDRGVPKADGQLPGIAR